MATGPINDEISMTNLFNQGHTLLKYPGRSNHHGLSGKVYSTGFRAGFKTVNGISIVPYSKTRTKFAMESRPDRMSFI
eukprot:7660416-Ditylum_brightwellii.AAC.1